MTISQGTGSPVLDPDSSPELDPEEVSPQVGPHVVDESSLVVTGKVVLVAGAVALAGVVVADPEVVLDVDVDVGGMAVVLTASVSVPV